LNGAQSDFVPESLRKEQRSDGWQQVENDVIVQHIIRVRFELSQVERREKHGEFRKVQFYMERQMSRLEISQIHENQPLDLSSPNLITPAITASKMLSAVTLLNSLNLNDSNDINLLRKSSWQR
jgi:hypothetical protein